MKYSIHQPTMPTTGNGGREKERMNRLITETDKLTQQMNDHIGRSYRTLENLENVADASNRLVDTTRQFHKKTKQARCRQCCKRIKGKLTWVTLALTVFCIAMMVVTKYAGICQDEFDPCPVMENPEFYLVAVMGVCIITLGVLFFVNMKMCCLCFEYCNTCCD